MSGLACALCCLPSCQRAHGTPRCVCFKERRRRAKEEAEWSTLYRLTCLLVALVVGFSPLLMLAAYFMLVGLGQEDGGKCSYAPSVNRSTAKLLYRGGAFLALLTSAEGPRAEYRRMVRAALENKRAYATRHHYSLYVLDDRRRGDADDAARPQLNPSPHPNTNPSPNPSPKPNPNPIRNPDPDPRRAPSACAARRAGSSCSRWRSRCGCAPTSGCLP